MGKKRKTKTAQSSKSTSSSCRYFNNGHCKIINGKCNVLNTKCVKHGQVRIVHKRASASRIKECYSRPTSYAIMASDPYETKTTNTKHNNSRNSSSSAAIEANISKKSNEIYENITTLYVYDSFKIISPINLEECRIKVKDINKRTLYTIYVAKHIPTGRFFISKHQLDKHIKDNHFFDIRFNNRYVDTYISGSFEFKLSSELKMYGYKVGMNGLNASRRHQILDYVIDNNIMSRHEITSLLTGNIFLREGRTDKDFSKAIYDWKEDIKYINTVK